MFKLTDGVNYVMENPMQKGRYISTTSSIQATEFTYKQARNLLQNKKKGLTWIKPFHLLNCDNGQSCNTSLNYKGNGGVYMGENDINFNEEIFNKILNEANSILGLAGWSIIQLKTYKEELLVGLSKYDSAESDINHALQKYKEDNYGRKPQAHKMAKVGYILDEIRDKHKRIKQCLRYVQVMEDAINNKYTIEKIKLELAKAKANEYKGRTEYYQLVLDVLK